MFKYFRLRLKVVQMCPQRVLYSLLHSLRPLKHLQYNNGEDIGGKMETKSRIFTYLIRKNCNEHWKKNKYILILCWSGFVDFLLMNVITD